MVFGGGGFGIPDVTTSTSPWKISVMIDDFRSGDSSASSRWTVLRNQVRNLIGSASVPGIQWYQTPRSNMKRRPRLTNAELFT